MKNCRHHRLRFSPFFTTSVLLILVFGCGRQTKDKVRDFFRPEVPVSEDRWRRKSPGLEKRKAEKEENRASAMGKALDLPPKGKKLALIHKPYASGRCDGCHVIPRDVVTSPKENESPSIGKGGRMPGILKAPRQRLCSECHESLSASKVEAKGLWLHTALAKGDWNVCHDPHQSENPGILIRKREMICLKCHSCKDLIKIPKHDQPEKCLNCHNPHMGKNRLLLRKEFYQEVLQEGQRHSISPPRRAAWQYPVSPNF